jgi:ferric-dicitrate binding protein FerR (iron transport regulator)
MRDDGSIRALLAPMIGREVDLDGEPFRVDRTRVLARMASAGVERRRWPATVVVLAAAAAVLLAVTTAEWSRRASDRLGVSIATGSAVHFQSATGQNLTLTGTHVIPYSGVLETGAGSRAQVSTSDGVAIELQGDTRVSLDALHAQESRLDLRRGAVRCAVAHRPASHPFLVVAPDVTVVDLGTVFSVRIDETTRATSVSVEEGEVLVKHRSGETRVKAPGAWSSVESPALSPPAASSAAAVLPSPSTSPPNSPPADKHQRAPGRASPPPKTTPAATLDEESRLLRLGLAAERQGHADEATSIFEQFLSRYPNSPLAPDARDALLRVKQGAP